MDWNIVLQPLAEALVAAAASAVIGGVSLGLIWLRAHFAVMRSASAVAVEAAFNVAVQAATQNAAGSVLGDIRTGAVDLTKPASLAASVSRAADIAAKKVPDSVAGLSLTASNVMTMVAQKTNILLASAPPTAA